MPGMMEAKMSHLGSQEQQLMGPKLVKGMATSRKDVEGAPHQVAAQKKALDCL
jgi:hypothetical protein